MNSFEIVASSTESTVVNEYTPEKRKSTDYQSEAELEQDFINRLVSQGYEYITIKSEQDLIDNLRTQLEKLNNYTFFDKEWNEFYNSVISNGNDGIVEKTRKIQEDCLQNLTLDNGYVKNIKLIDKNNIHNNHLQVINQYEEDGGKRDTRYDVTILVNGLPLVHIELKKRGNAIREAFNQINRYQRDSFWAGCGLYQYVQLFVISNGTHTKYYSNTTRFQHIKDNVEKNAAKRKKTSNSFEFTSYWADEKNHTIPDLVDFTKTFFAKHFAEEVGFNFLCITPAALKSRFVNATQENIAKMFKEAEEKAPTVIFIDEMNELVPNRADGNVHEMSRSAVNEMLAQMDRTGERGIFVIGATNYPNMIDTAILRAGRLDKKYFIGAPDEEARMALFKLYLEKRPYDFGLDYQQLAEMTQGYVSADIQLIVNDAARNALHQHSKITMELLKAAISNTRPSLSADELRKYDRIRKMMNGEDVKKPNDRPRIGFNI